MKYIQGFNYITQISNTGHEWTINTPCKRIGTLLLFYAKRSCNTDLIMRPNGEAYMQEKLVKKRTMHQNWAMWIYTDWANVPHLLFIMAGILKELHTPPQVYYIKDYSQMADLLQTFLQMKIHNIHLNMIDSTACAWISANPIRINTLAIYKVYRKARSLGWHFSHKKIFWNRSLIKDQSLFSK